MFSTNIKFNFISYKDDIILKMFDILYKKDSNTSNKNNNQYKNSNIKTEQYSSLFIFPNHFSKNKAIEIFRNYWQLDYIEFLTMEELKEILMSCNFPVISEDKRKVLLYSCFLDSNAKELKQYFNITDFFESINFLNSFFNFFDELSDEFIDPFSLKSEESINEINLLSWQKEYLNKLLDILLLYKNKLEQKSIIDKIFLIRNLYIEKLNKNNDDNNNLKNLDKSYKKNIFENNLENYLAKFNNVIIVNQYYFSKFEKFIIEKIINNFLKRINIRFFLHLPESLQFLYDKENLTFKPVDLTLDRIIYNLIGRIKLKNVEIYKNSSLLKSFYLLLLRLNKEKNLPELIINNKPDYDQFYYFFRNNSFTKNIVLPISESKLYKLLQSFLIFFKNHENLTESKNFHNSDYKTDSKNSIIKKNGIILIYIESFIQVLGCEEFYQFFNIKEPTKLINKLSLLQQNNFLYLRLGNIKLENDIFENNNESQRFFKNYELNKMAGFLYDFYSISSIKEFTDFFYNILNGKNNEINEDKGFKFSNEYSIKVIDYFLEALNDFNNIINLNIVSENNFRKFFLTDIKTNKSYSLSILQFFLNYLKSRNFVIEKKDYKSQVRITTLNNTRNISFSNLIYFFNVIEGILPSEKKPLFLLNENQRANLGLKTYNHIREREKYYFLRLLFNTEQAILFTVEDEQNYIPSSFLEEVKLFVKKYNFLEKKYIEENNIQDIGRRDIRQNEYVKLREYDFVKNPDGEVSDYLIFKSFFNINLPEDDDEVKHHEEKLQIYDNNFKFDFRFDKQPIDLFKFIKYYHKFKNPYFEILKNEGEIIEDGFTIGWPFSFYKYQLFYKDKLSYFLKYLAELNEIKTESELSITNLILGNIIHFLFKNLNIFLLNQLDSYIKNDTNNKNYDNYFVISYNKTDNKVLKLNREQIIKKLKYFVDILFDNMEKEIFYKIPKNISRDYFYYFIYPLIEQRIINYYNFFFNKFISPNIEHILNGGFFSIIEGEVYNNLFNFNSNTKSYVNNKNFFDIKNISKIKTLFLKFSDINEFNKCNDFSKSMNIYYPFKLNIYINGIPDFVFIIDNRENKSVFICDYKTGKYNKELDFQMLIYKKHILSIFKHLFDNTLKSKSIETYIYFIFKDENKKIETERKKGKRRSAFEDFTNKIVDFSQKLIFETKTKSNMEKEYRYIYYPD